MSTIANMEWIKQIFKRTPQSIPEPMWQACVARLEFLNRLSVPERLELKRLAEELLATKSFSGAGGFELTDEIAVLIAAQAALPVLNLTLDLYDDLYGIVVYPSEFIVPHSEMDEAGVVHEWQEPVAGEAHGAGGAIVLSWEDVESGERAGVGFNVLIHEFVHKIDMQHGDANGRPPFLADYHAGMNADEWKRQFSDAFDDFTARVDQLEQQLPEEINEDDPTEIAHYDALMATLLLDPYAATHPAEFFAVAAEAFFVKPAPLAGAYPAVYQLMQRYFRQNPLAAP